MLLSAKYYNCNYINASFVYKIYHMQDKFLLLSMDALNEVNILSCLSICNDICHSRLMHGDWG